jgi:hypothetical protein
MSANSKLEDIVKKILPRGSSFIPGKLVPNMIENYRNALIKDHHKVDVNKIKSNSSLNIFFEVMRIVPAVILSYGENYHLGAMYYTVITYFFDRASYFGVEVGN